MDKFIGIVSGHRQRFYIRDESEYSFFAMCRDCFYPGQIAHDSKQTTMPAPLKSDTAFAKRNFPFFLFAKPCSVVLLYRLCADFCKPFFACFLRRHTTTLPSVGEGER